MVGDDWISVKDRLPSPDQYAEGDDVLVNVSKFGRSDSNSHYAIIFYDHTSKAWKDDDFRNYEDNADYMLVTHWMELPEGPIFLKDVLDQL